jgi:predicted nucleic acid-binding protein
VKLYVPEDGYGPVRRLPAPLLISVLAHVEVAAALWRKHRSGELDLDDTHTLTRALAADCAGTPEHPPRFLALAVTDGIVERAAELAATHGLRAYDAVQLASALAARAADASCATFASFDGDLTAAATAEGFGALPVAPPVR